MLTAEGCRQRRERLWSKVPSDVAWLLIADPRHVHYLANFWVPQFSFSTGERGLLLLERDGGTTLFADNFTIRSSGGDAHVDHLVEGKWYDHKHSVLNRDHVLFNALATAKGRLAGKPGLAEREWLPEMAAAIVIDNPATPASVDLGSLLRTLRRNKSPDELDLLKQAMRATEAGHARAREVVKPGLTEYDMFREVYAAVLAAAGKPVGIYGDFRATNPQHPKAGGLPTQYVLQEGDLFLLDYSVVVDGYRSDFTNGLSVGKTTQEQRRLMELCTAAMRGGESQLRAGSKARDVFAAAAGPLRDAGYDLGHHAGHGIGLGHPEPPILVPDSDDVLEAGDVVTLEPGLYLPGLGGLRIEHNYLITATGFERLSNHRIEL